jgi:hypothetical protein
VNVENKEQLKQQMHIHSPHKPKQFKQTSASQKADGNYFLGQKRSADGEFMQQGTTITSLTLKKYTGRPFGTKGVEC